MYNICKFGNFSKSNQIKFKEKNTFSLNLASTHVYSPVYSNYNKYNIIT